MSELRVTAIASLHAEFSVPGDKSISHRAAIFSGLANGLCSIRNFLPSEDCINTLNAMQALAPATKCSKNSLDMAQTSWSSTAGPCN